VAGQLAALDDPSLVLGRVVRVDRGACDVLAVAAPGEPTVRAVVGPAVLAQARVDPQSTPCVGDWVGVATLDDGRISLERVLPRRTAFVRGAVAGTSHGQVLAANIDIAVIVEGLLPEPDIGRIERFLALAWDSGAQPVVVLTKADLVPDAEALRADVGAAAPGVDVLAVSGVTGEGMAELVRLAAPGVTLALLGPSGAGKSTLANALSGGERMVTRELRADGKGRHTTVHRELIGLDSGAFLIDTPGLRSVGLVGVQDAVDRVFSDIDELASECRFSDCGHTAEPGCAVLQALETGELPHRRFESWRKLQREAHRMAMRHDARLRQAERDRWKRIHAEVRRSGRIRP